MFPKEIPDELIDQLLAGREGPESITGPDGLLKQLTRRVVERAASAELTEHLGYELAAEPPEDQPNRRNGLSSKTLITDHGPVEVDLPRDREGSFEPQIVPKHQRRFAGFDDKIISMYARGMSTREISKHLEEIYGVDVGRDTISRVTDAVLDDVKEWQARPLEKLYLVVWLDAIVLKIRDQGSVRNKHAYLAIGVGIDGIKETLGIWLEANEGAKFWLRVISELKARGVEDILVFSVDGLKGFPQAIEAVYPQAIVQTCIVHMIRNSLRFTSYKDRKQLVKDLRMIYTAATEEAAEAGLETFAGIWDSRYPQISQSWRDAWEQVIPYFAFPPALRRAVYTTDESVKCPLAPPVVESVWARVTPDRRAGRGDGSPAAQDCRLTASESHPSGGTRARSLRCFGLPVGDELPVGALGLLAQSAFSGPHLLQVVGVGGSALAAA
jgi:putative transposase